MPITAGKPPTAGQLMRLQPVIYTAFQTGNAGNQQALTTSLVDCLGCSVSFTTTTAANWSIVAFFDLDVPTAGSSVGVGRISVDGTTITGAEAHMSGASVSRATPGQVWAGQFAAAGSHTVKSQVIKSAAVAVINAIDLHTRFVITVYEVV